MFLIGIRIAGAAVIALVAMMAFAPGAMAQAECPECEEYTLDIPEPEPDPVVAPAPVAPIPVEPVPVEPVAVEPEPEKKPKPKPDPPFINPYDGLGLSQPLAFQRGDAVSALSRAGFVIPMGIALLVMTGLLIRSRRQLRQAHAEGTAPGEDQRL